MTIEELKRDMYAAELLHAKRYLEYMGARSDLEKAKQIFTLADIQMETAMGDLCAARVNYYEAVGSK